MRLLDVLLLGTLAFAIIGCSEAGEDLFDDPDRGPIGKADHVSGHCSTNSECDGRAADGTCYCDAVCAYYGDCCDDLHDYCPQHEYDSCDPGQPDSCDGDDVCIVDTCKPAFGRSYVLTVNTAHLPEDWGQPDLYVNVEHNGSEILRTSTDNNTNSAQFYDDSVTVAFDTGDRLAFKVFDDRRFGRDPTLFTCGWMPVSASLLREGMISCSTTDGRTVSASIVPFLGGLLFAPSADSFCDADCSSCITDIGSVRGDGGLEAIHYVGSQENAWLSVSVFEDFWDGGWDPHRARIELFNPPGVDFDLFVYCGSCPTGNNLIGSSRKGSGKTDVVDYVRGGRHNALDARDLIIEVRNYRGDTLGLGEWQLQVTGNLAADSTPDNTGCSPLKN